MTPQIPDKLDKTVIGRLAFFINHFFIEPLIWVIGIYGIAVGSIAAYTFGFFTLKQYSFDILTQFLSQSVITKYALWYQIYPYSIIIFGSYILALYYKFNKMKKGFLALPIWMLTYWIWDFIYISYRVFTGFSIIWAGIGALGLIYYLPIRKQFSYEINFYTFILFIACGVMYFQDAITIFIPSTYPLIPNLQEAFSEGSFALLCLTSIKLKLTFVSKTNN